MKSAARYLEQIQEPQVQSPAIPPDEAHRLDVLRGLCILDTPMEERFDRITRVAQRLFDVPIALVSLVDADRQWFKSRQGLDATETPRGISFCGHAILSDSTFVINDATTDARFADNPLVTGPPHVCFYAGQPLHAADGSRLGTLCIIDRKSRDFSPAARALLADLAAWVARELNEQTLAQAVASADASRRQLRGVIDASTQVAIIATDPQGLITLFNSGAERMLGYSAAEMVGKQTPAIIHLESEVVARGEALSRETGRRIAGFDAFVEYARQGRHDEREWTYVRKDGSSLVVDLVVTAVRDGPGEITGFLGVAIDVTGRKAVERLKSEFVSTVSHELRTPLTSIMGSLDLIAKGAVGEVAPQVAPLIEIAHKNSARLVRLINDILDIDKIESGSMRFDLHPHDLKSLIAHAIDANRDYARQFGVNLILAREPPDASVEVDGDRMLQVLTNLLSNAAKFSPSGADVTVAIDRVDGRVRIEVTDRGPGISPEFAAKIFQKFSQADSSDTRRKGGSGLGLNITRVLVEHMGGSIGFTSLPGAGATFFVEFPEATPFAGVSAPAGTGPAVPIR